MGRLAEKNIDESTHKVWLLGLGWNVFVEQKPKPELSQFTFQECPQ